MSVAASLGLAANAVAGIAQQRAEPQFHAPRAQLWRLVIDGLFGGSSALASVAVVLESSSSSASRCSSRDFAKGVGRRKWVWVTFAALASSSLLAL